MDTIRAEMAVCKAVKIPPKEEKKKKKEKKLVVVRVKRTTKQLDECAKLASEICQSVECAVYDHTIIILHWVSDS